MSTYPTLTCMECKAPLGWKAVVKKCKVCRMDLCKKCARKHGGVCVWCAQHAPGQYVTMNKAATIAMIIMPAFILFMPAPMPAVLLIATNPYILIPMAIYAGAAYIVLGIMKSTAAKKMVALIPADVEQLDERGTTARDVQAQDLTRNLATRNQEQIPAGTVGTTGQQAGPGTTITCQNCGNVFQKTPGASFCPACGFAYRD